MPQESRFTGQDAVRERLINAILDSKSAYDAEFARIHDNFAPMLRHLDSGKPNVRTVIFIDPMKYANAKALGIDPADLFNAAARRAAEDGGNQRLANSLTRRPLHLGLQMSVMLSMEDGRTLLNGASTTAPAADRIVDKFKNNVGCMVIPQSHIGFAAVAIKGMTPGEISTFVNYHEFFHCMDDRLAFADRPGLVKVREIFADVGACAELIRKGAPPSIIDGVMAWRAGMPDPDHNSVAALKELKEHVRKNGVETLRAMSEKDVLDLGYKIAEAHAPSSRIGWYMTSLWETLSPVKMADAFIRTMTPGMDATPRGWDPARTLEDKAFAMGGKITPTTLIRAQHALQREYRQKADAGPSSQQYVQMMIGIDSAVKTAVTSTHYETVNAKRGARLTQEDREDIAFVQKRKIPLPSNTPAKGPQKP